MSSFYNGLIYKKLNLTAKIQKHYIQPCLEVKNFIFLIQLRQDNLTPVSEK